MPNSLHKIFKKATKQSKALFSQHTYFHQKRMTIFELVAAQQRGAGKAKQDCEGSLNCQRSGDIYPFAIPSRRQCEELTKRAYAQTLFQS